MSMYVVKRDGRQEKVSFDKITARISKLAYGLNREFCDPLLVAQKVVRIPSHLVLPSCSFRFLSCELLAPFFLRQPFVRPDSLPLFAASLSARRRPASTRA